MASYTDPLHRVTIVDPEPVWEQVFLSNHLDLATAKIASLYIEDVHVQTVFLVLRSGEIDALLAGYVEFGESE